MSLVRFCDCKRLGDDRGLLIAIEGCKGVPFDIKRVYYIYNTASGVARGFHAHKELKQVAVCVSGSCRFILDNGVEKESVILEDPSRGLFIDSLIWHEMHDFSDDCVLVLLASDYYDEADYLRDYEGFLNEIG